jgi:hypothetical protein
LDRDMPKPIEGVIFSQPWRACPVKLEILCIAARGAPEEVGVERDGGVGGRVDGGCRSHTPEAALASSGRFERWELPPRTGHHLTKQADSRRPQGSIWITESLLSAHIHCYSIHSVVTAAASAGAAVAFARHPDNRLRLGCPALSWERAAPRVFPRRSQQRASSPRRPVNGCACWGQRDTAVELKGLHLGLTSRRPQRAQARATGHPSVTQ